MKNIVTVGRMPVIDFPVLSGLSKGQLFRRPNGEAIYIYCGVSYQVNRHLHIQLKTGGRNWSDHHVAMQFHIQPLPLGTHVGIAVGDPHE